jgi:predicted dithiol-disulfide oxidoreductase (DUF899 family)
MQPKHTVSQDEWLAARRALLAKEKAHMRAGDALAAERRGFNYDSHVSFTKDQIRQGRIEYNLGTITDDPRYLSEELPGVSVFAAGAEGELFLTYSTFARGLDMLLTADHYLDLTPEGRNEKAYPAWPRRHDEYPAI